MRTLLIEIVIGAVFFIRPHIVCVCFSKEMLSRTEPINQNAYMSAV